MHYIESGADLQQHLNRLISEVKIIDIHTHVYDTPFKELLLWGIDELINYHYLIAELFRKSPHLSPETFWAMSKSTQAEMIWETLFLNHSPLSEACRGVITVLSQLGLQDLRTKSLDDIRAFFAQKNVADYINEVFRLTNIKTVVMTNDPFDDKERRVWLKSPKIDARFQASLRIDPLLMQWESVACPQLQAWNYQVAADFSGNTINEIRRFLSEWLTRLNALYLAVSLPPDFTFPEASPRGKIIQECILPVCQKHRVPWALMIGVKKLINPDLKLAGDGVGKADLTAVETLVRRYPQNKFLVTLLSRENQHELCVLARKFNNLMPFGCWWFLNNPSIIEEMTRERLELLGLSFIPQHSDARVLDQLIYKWHHSKIIIKKVLFEKYADLLSAGWPVTPAELERDLQNLFGGVFTDFIG